MVSSVMNILNNLGLSYHFCRLPILEDDWYFSQYSDVANSTFSAKKHFVHYGSREGRLPNQDVADLWSKNDTSVIPQLLEYAFRGDVNGHAARWVLSRWYAFNGQWKSVYELYDESFFTYFPTCGLGEQLIFVDALINNSHLNQAQHVIDHHHLLHTNCCDWWLIKANLILRHNVLGVRQWLECLNHMYSQFGLVKASVQDSQKPVLDNLTCEVVQARLVQTSPVVSVVVPVRNAEHWIGTAILSLLSQTWTNLEIIVVDDASNDRTLSVVDAFRTRHKSIRVINHDKPQGTYAARNTGVQAANGDFVTVHDADDWSHCEKIACQVQALKKHPNAMASVSHWVRASTDLEFGGWHTPENWSGWIHKNVSSLMVRRRVIDELGYWDAVRCSADTEYYYRLIQAYGAKSIVEVLPGVPLSIGRSHPQSLTQLKETNVFTIFGGVRKTYHQAFTQWHKAAKSRHDLYMPQYPTKRLFPAPAEICLATIEQE